MAEATSKGASFGWQALPEKLCKINNRLTSKYREKLAFKHILCSLAEESGAVLD